MKRIITSALLGLFVVSLTGCPAAKTDAVTGADQSAIEAYKAAEAEEQAKLSGEMKASQ
ncbi:hypothetical protein NHH03_24430 [Stieleria sp. TO1_6]|uniref:hypothetical protein n=1 Tax=Stieleria tagensis TaxID=2956795 RepID=UPI00209AA8DC|nr:hypothetical protein [Stieleria tagensis]MCO8124907.1 hypothetical protein [Stieleria tagensis]